MGRHVAVFAAGAALLFTMGTITASARHRNHSESAPGEFDYYLLSLSWSPAFCLQSPGAAECNGPRRFGFIVHGLWPQNERGWPEHCGEGDVPESVVQGIADLMPARGLVFHEWSAHGTCSGLAPADFFDAVRRAYASVRLPPAFTLAGNAVEQPPESIAAAFLRANPRLPSDAVVVTCSRQGEPRLREVHVCLTRNLEPRSCSADALREACRAPSVIVPPIR
jgi:ribonuclease T2